MERCERRLGAEDVTEACRLSGLGSTIHEEHVQNGDLSKILTYRQRLSNNPSAFEEDQKNPV
jgi:hypothetical protein